LFSFGWSSLISTKLRTLLIKILYKECGKRSWAWWCLPVIPTLRCLREEDLKSEAILGYIETMLKKNKKWGWDCWGHSSSDRSLA
jgi:hypothetical protein